MHISLKIVKFFEDFVIVFFSQKSLKMKLDLFEHTFVYEVCYKNNLLFFWLNVLLSKNYIINYKNQNLNLLQFLSYVFDINIFKDFVFMFTKLFFQITIESFIISLKSKMDIKFD